MSNRLSKGTVVAGRYAQDIPGFPKMGPAVSVVGPASTAEQTSSFTFGANDVVQSFLVKVTTAASSTNVMHIGLTGTPTGFVSSLPVGSTGVKALLAAVSSSGSSPSWFYSASYLGVLLGGYNAGTTEGSTGLNSAGAWVGKMYACDGSTEKRLSWSLNSTQTAFAATIYPIYYSLTT